MADAILIWDDYAQEPARRFRGLPRRATYDEYIAYYYRRNLARELPIDAGPGSRNAVAGFVDSGRWIWQCGACRSGMPVQPGRPSICVRCGFGDWVNVLLPLNMGEIEEELLRQPGNRYAAPIRRWVPGMSIEDLRDRTRKAMDVLRLAPDKLVRALSIGQSRVWMVGEILTAANMNTFASDILDDLSGDNGVIELRDSVQAPGLRAPGGTTAQRPTSAAGLLRWNLDDTTFDMGLGGGSWDQMLNSSVVNFANLNANGDVGTAADELAPGSHGHLMTLHGWDYLAGSRSVQTVFGPIIGFRIDNVPAGDYIAIVIINSGGPPNPEWQLRIWDETTDSILTTFPNTWDGSLTMFSGPITVPANTNHLFPQYLGGSSTSARMAFALVRFSTAA